MPDLQEAVLRGALLNRYAWVIAAAYTALAVVGGGMYLSTTSKWVDYSQTQLQFSTTNSTFVVSVDVTSLASGGKSIAVGWRFANQGRLPLTIAIFEFHATVDNGSDSRNWADAGKIATEYSVFLSFQLDRRTGPVVAPFGILDRGWTANVTAPADVARIVPHADGRYYLAFTDVRIVYYISDVDNGNILYGGPFLRVVAP